MKEEEEETVQYVERVEEKLEEKGVAAVTHGGLLERESASASRGKEGRFEEMVEGKGEDWLEGGGESREGRGSGLEGEASWCSRR